MTKEEIVSRLSEETGVDEYQAKLVIDSLWSGVRYYIQNVEECRGGILLPGFLTFKLKTYKLEKTLAKNAKRVNSNEFYEKLLNLNKQYERKKRKKNVN